MYTWEQRKAYYDKDYFDTAAKEPYREWWWTCDAVWQPRAKLIKDAFEPDNVLVCGCAKGSLVKYLLKMGIDTLGFDLSGYAIGETPFPEIKDRLLLHDLAMEPLPCSDRQFDLAVAFDFFEHQDNEHIKFVCDEVARVTDGYILIRQPLVGSIDADNIEHPNAYTREMLLLMFPEFKEYNLPELFYGIDVEAEPILPKQDTMVLRRKE